MNDNFPQIPEETLRLAERSAKNPQNPEAQQLGEELLRYKNGAERAYKRQRHVLERPPVEVPSDGIWDGRTNSDLVSR